MRTFDVLPARRDATRTMPPRASRPSSASTASAWCTRLEPAFRADFGHVRLHVDAAADRAARAFDARAVARGADIYFAQGAFRPESTAGLSLLAHELAHVVQQRGDTPKGHRSVAYAQMDQASEHEAEQAASDAVAGRAVRVMRRPETVARQGRGRKAPQNMVVYTGGTSGTLNVVKDGVGIYSTRAVSGHAGFEEWERGAGPIPSGTYTLHPQQIAATVTKPQGGTCSASPISAGYQEITSDAPQACAKASHYCTIDCAAQFGAGITCYTPRSCWGARRMKIEGRTTVTKPEGGTVTRSGFYIHGGDHAVNVTSGCIKVFDDTAFDRIRELPGRVPLCVGKACPPWALQAANAAIVQRAVEALREQVEALLP